MEDLELTPYAPNLVESTRSIGYSFQTALADIIDNSISNLAQSVNVRFSNGEDAFVAVIDNGIGMTSEALENAMRYGSSNSLDIRASNDLGRFGLGLKMASLSQCRKLTVITKKSNVISAASWDLDYINKTKKWMLKRYDQESIKRLRFFEELKNQSSGTIVIWEKLDRIVSTTKDFDKEFNEKLDLASKHMSLVFHRFISNNNPQRKFELFFNNRKLKPLDPYFINNPSSQQLETETLFINRKPIKITPFIMPFFNNLTNNEKMILNEYKDLELKQGLYIYRNNRLIVWGKWFRISSDGELKRLTKIRIDLPNNIDEFWTIDVKKSSAQIPSIIKEQLRIIVERAVGKSERVYKYRGRKIVNDNYEHVWNKVMNRDKMEYLINREMPTFRILADTLDDRQFKLLDIFIKTVEDTFPYASVYYDLAKEEKYNENTLLEDEVYEMMNTMIESSLEAEALIKTFKTMDIFSKYPAVINKIEEEYIGE